VPSHRPGWPMWVWCAMRSSSIARCYLEPHCRSSIGPQVAGAGVRPRCCHGPAGFESRAGKARSHSGLGRHRLRPVITAIVPAPASRIWGSVSPSSTNLTAPCNSTAEPSRRLRIVLGPGAMPANRLSVPSSPNYKIRPLPVLCMAVAAMAVAYSRPEALHGGAGCSVMRGCGQPARESVREYRVDKSISHLCPLVGATIAIRRDAIEVPAPAEDPKLSTALLPAAMGWWA